MGNKLSFELLIDDKFCFLYLKQTGKIYKSDMLLMFIL